MVEGAGFEPAKTESSDLQSDPFDRSGTPPILTTNMPDKIILPKNGSKNHVRSWSWREESNPRPADYKSAALPAELRQHKLAHALWLGLRILRNLLNKSKLK